MWSLDCQKLGQIEISAERYHGFLMPIPVVRAKPRSGSDLLQINPSLLAEFLVYFLQEECIRQRKIKRAVLGLSGGLDSTVVAYLCARAFGAENVHAIRMPYKISSSNSLTDAELVINDLGIQAQTIDITDMVDGYAAPADPPLSPTRLGNVCARCRMTILFDQSEAIGALPIGTGNKTERMFGYYTWHGDDAPPINPLGDLFKTQVIELARELGVPQSIIEKPPSADLVHGQTDEGDFGITYQVADEILALLMSHRSRDQVVRLGYQTRDVDRVIELVSGTHWKRRSATVAMTSTSSINDYYLRPVDLRNQF